MGKRGRKREVGVRGGEDDLHELGKFGLQDGNTSENLIAG